MARNGGPQFGVCLILSEIVLAGDLGHLFPYFPIYLGHQHLVMVLFFWAVQRFAREAGACTNWVEPQPVIW